MWCKRCLVFSLGAVHFTQSSLMFCSKYLNCTFLKQPVLQCVEDSALDVNLSNEDFYLVWMLCGIELVREPSILDDLPRQLHFLTWLNAGNHNQLQLYLCAANIYYCAIKYFWHSAVTDIAGRRTTIFDQHVQYPQSKMSKRLKLGEVMHCSDEHPKYIHLFWMLHVCQCRCGNLNILHQDMYLMSSFQAHCT